jgi:hypothetical protein
MKKLLFLLLFFPLIASAQLDFESNKFKLDFVKLPEIESLISSSLPLNTGFSKKISSKLPSFKMNKSNYRQPVSMYEAMAANDTYVKSDIQISLDPREYGVYGGSSSYSSDGASKVKNIAYKDASFGFLTADSCPPFGICPRCAHNRINGY